MVKKAVIICGGLATRFLPISKSIPKEMLPVLNKPILQVLVEDLKKANVDDILIIVGRNKECIERHFTHNIELEQNLINNNKLDLLEVANSTNMLIHFLIQDAPRGTGHCVKLAKTFTGDDPFVLLYGDELMLSEGKSNIQQMVDCYNKYQKSLISTQTCDMKDVHKYGIIAGTPVDDDTLQVDFIVEKPKREDAPSNICNLGNAILTKDIYTALEALPPTTGEIPITDAYDILAKEGNLLATNVKGNRLDMGNPLGFLIANIEYALTTEFSEELKTYLKDLNSKL